MALVQKEILRRCRRILEIGRLRQWIFGSELCLRSPKAAEGRRTPGCWREVPCPGSRGSVPNCASPLAFLQERQERYATAERVVWRRKGRAGLEPLYLGQASGSIGG